MTGQKYLVIKEGDKTIYQLPYTDINKVLDLINLRWIRYNSYDLYTYCDGYYSPVKMPVEKAI